ncbi:uncharacterized protein LOC132271270 [Cornus florida]|uniref:uncharacterized protein LOC132271270 n=1 Tax=Cornus florida TaxID=4283 RepID=UPI002897402E|nr:uncharacterized protein LOC132271270 [Cornus florida]
MDDTEIWWKTITHTYDVTTITYDVFKQLFYEKYFLVPKKRELRTEFVNLKQGNMSVTKYENKFTSISWFELEIANDEEEKTLKFVNSLNFTIRLAVATAKLTEYAKAVRKALVVEAESKSR